MSIDFHAQKNRGTYASREAQPDWAATIRTILDPTGKHVADIGCGGGIYSAAWANIGAADIVGVDSSEQMILAAAEKTKRRSNIRFQTGDALATGLPSASVDIVFARALIHHLRNYTKCFQEAHRILRAEGDYIIQDRTPEDVRLPGSPDHVRGYFFECFPKLIETEMGRRPTDVAVRNALLDAGFHSPRVLTVWETRKVYRSFDDLSKDLLGRTGRSILHDLTDHELTQLVEFINKRMASQSQIIERDRWTIWSSKAGSVERYKS